MTRRESVLTSWYQDGSKWEGHIKMEESETHVLKRSDDGGHGGEREGKVRSLRPVNRTVMENSEMSEEVTS